MLHSKNETQTYAVNVTNACMSYGLLRFQAVYQSPTRGFVLFLNIILRLRFVFLVLFSMSIFCIFLCALCFCVKSSKETHNFNSNFGNSKTHNTKHVNRLVKHNNDTFFSFSFFFQFPRSAMCFPFILHNFFFCGNDFRVVILITSYAHVIQFY